MFPLLIVITALRITLATASELQPVREVNYSISFGNHALPAFDKGFLVFTHRQPDVVTVFGPNGTLLYNSAVKGPGGVAASVMSAAVDMDGGLAAGIAYAGRFGYAGGIVLLDKNGQQTRFVETGQYMPANLCIADDRSIWSLGWQRDATLNDHADREDYFIFRKYSRDGMQIGAFMPRSLFPAGLSPGKGRGGLWKIRAAKDRIGAIVYPGQVANRPEWVELDFDGNLIGKWAIGRESKSGLAFTQDGNLYQAVFDEKRKLLDLTAFDRNHSRWRKIGAEFSPKLLLGADGNDLVFGDSRGTVQLQWFRLIDAP